MNVVMSEGPEHVVSWRRLNLAVYCSNEMGLYVSGRKPVMESNFGRKSFVSAYSSGICCAAPRRILSP